MLPIFCSGNQNIPGDKYCYVLLQLLHARISQCFFGKTIFSENLEKEKFFVQCNAQTAKCSGAASFVSN